MKNSSIAAVLAVVTTVLLSSPARAENAFMGHYGYMLSYSTAYAPSPEFRGAIEMVDLFPASCQGLKKRMDCAKRGMVELAALPKTLVAGSIGAKTLDAFVATILADAKKEGLKASSRRTKTAGFPSAAIKFPGHPEPLNEMILVEGSKVYYRFKYNDKAGAKAAAAMAASLKEVAPHDNPPKPGR